MPHDKIQSGAINIQDNEHYERENDKTPLSQPSQFSEDKIALVSIANNTRSGAASIGSQKVSSRNNVVGPAGRTTT